MAGENPEETAEGVCLFGIYRTLLDELGRQDWWPAETPFEVIVGALLTQQTRWPNVETAIANLREKGLLDAESLSATECSEIEELIRCTGFYRQKARRLRDISRFFTERGMDNLFDLPVDELRKALLSLGGVGPETADSIILYAAEKPKFVIDAYTKRIMGCLGIYKDYHDMQRLFETSLPADVELYKEYHALIVEYAKKYCGRKQCDSCLLTGGNNGA
jgi:endonuclease-3 related protein